MEAILFASALMSLAILLTISNFLIRDAKNSLFRKKEIPLIVLGSIHLILTILFSLWAFGNLGYNTKDFIIIFSISLVLQTICISTILYDIRKNKKFLQMLIPFLFLIPLIAYSPESIHLTIPTSLLIMLLSFLSITNIHEKTTRYMIIYSSTSLFLYLLSASWQKLIPILSLASMALSLLFLINFLKFLKKAVRYKEISRGKYELPIIHFLKHFVFIIIITNFVFIGTVSVHEFGHLLSSSKSNCEGSKIVYELQGLPHTEVKCTNAADQNSWIVGGILLPLLIAMALFFSGGKFIKEIALQIIGFDLIISFLDIKSLTSSQTIAAFMLLVGIILIILSLGLLAKSRIE